MPGMSDQQNALIIGGGFYGISIAIYLAKQRGFKHILLVEQEPDLHSRASYHNQARVHNGYHYPRSFTTAYRSRINLPHFLRDWPEAVHQNFTKLYAISRRNSKVTSQQFQRFCKEIGAKIQPAPPALRALFDPRLIEDVFLVEEYAFNATQLMKQAELELKQYGVQLLLNTKATAISKSSHALYVQLQGIGGVEKLIVSDYVFNCTYSGLNQLQGDFQKIRAPLKHEIAEMALFQLPPDLQQLGITVMDGPFFSIMPFPSRQLHTLSHVRYTPHVHWQDEKNLNPYQKLRDYSKESRHNRMIRDAQRYIPRLHEAKYIESLFEVKTLLEKNETDDGRPIFFEKHAELPGCYSVLGGKIDNIYDILQKLDEESFSNRMMQ